MTTRRLLPLLLLPACAGLVHCLGNDDPFEPGIPIAIKEAFPNLGFTNPLYFAQAPGDDTQSYVVTQAGVVYRFEHRADVATKTPFLDIDSLVTDAGGEMGLLGLAFDPAFASNGYLYVDYNPNFDTSGSNPRRTVIARFHAASGAVDPATETPLLTFNQPYDNHKGGWLGFGPDGKLYIATGDGGGTGDPQNNAQNLDSLLGKILRINPSGTIPSDNPFVGVTGRDEIWAYGFRNPYRASFDRANGQFLAGDVGQGQREEIDVVAMGRNYGWRKFEGSLVYNASDPTPDDAVAPTYEYAHLDNRCSIIGGYVYRGAALAGHSGSYFYADYCTGEVWELTRRGPVLTNSLVGVVPAQVSSFGEDLAGELYITAFDGKVYTLAPGP